MAYGGRAYDDDKPWWQEDGDNDSNNNNKASNNMTDDFDAPYSSTSTPSNFHGTTHHGQSYGVYNKSKYSSAYDDNDDAYARYTGKSKSTTNIHTKSQSKQQNQPKTNPYDPYQSIMSKSKHKASKSQNQLHFQKTNPYTNNAYDYNDDDEDDSDDETDDFDTTPSMTATSNQSKSSSFATKPIYKQKSNPYQDDLNNAYSKKPTKSNPIHARSQSSRNVYKSQHESQGVSNPAYRRQLRAKYRNGRINEEYTNRTKRAQRQRPELHTVEQQQEYKQQLRQQTKQHLDESLRTAYQSEEIAADTSEKLYYQRKKLENVDKMLHETDQNLDRTEHTLKGMKSIWGGISNYFKKPPERQVYEKRKNEANHMNVDNKMMQMEKERIQKGYGKSKKSKKVKLGGSTEEDEEFNDKLDDLHKSVMRMRLMAENMNRELDDQGGLLDNIDEKMSKVNGRIGKQTDTIKRIR